VCGDGVWAGGLQLVLFQPILWSMAKVLKVGYENCTCWTEAFAGEMRRAHDNGKGAE